ncbi:MAG: hypothetical protein ACD_45C00554G0001 [uncultured bacterium]|nr:MAG: hypothetical protein ACD_45C00554G0001 [uncultured bacterium]
MSAQVTGGTFQTQIVIHDLIIAGAQDVPHQNYQLSGHRLALEV